MKRHVTETQERAAYLQAKYSQRLEGIRGDKHLSEDGRRRELAQVFLRARDELRRLREEEAASLASRRRSIERSLFGFGSARGDAAMLSFRDAQQRVADIKSPRQALALLEGAERSGDHVLAQAIAAHAWGRSWRTVLDAYAAERPGVIDQFHALDEIERLEGRHGAGNRMTSDMLFRLQPPQELRGTHTDLALRRLAFS